MTMAVKHILLAWLGEPQRTGPAANLLRDPGFRELGCGGDLLRFLPRAQLRPFVHQRQCAAWLKPEERTVRLLAPSQIGDLLANQLPGFAQISFTDHGPATTNEPRQFNPATQSLR